MLRRKKQPALVKYINKKYSFDYILVDKQVFLVYNINVKHINT